MSDVAEHKRYLSQQRKSVDVTGDEPLNVARARASHMTRQHRAHFFDRPHEDRRMWDGRAQAGRMLPPPWEGVQSPDRSAREGSVDLASPASDERRSS